MYPIVYFKFDQTVINIWMIHVLINHLLNQIQWCVYVEQADTHVAVVVQQVVGQFEFIKGDDLLHPLGTFGRRVRVIVDSARRGGVSFTGNQPRRAVEGVPAWRVI